MFRNELKITAERLFSKHYQQTVISKYSLAEEKISIHFLSEELHQLYYRSLKHIQLTSESDEKEFHLYVIPSSALGSEKCMIAARKNFLSTLCKKINFDPDQHTIGEIYTKCHQDYYYIMDYSNRFALWVVNTNKPIDSWYRVSPFQHFFQEFMSLSKKQMTHAAVISNNDYGILLTGGSGAGKTTTTLLALEHGYHYVSEDYCVLAKRNNQLYAYSVFNSMKMTENTYQRVSHLFENDPIHILAPGKSKRAYFLSEQKHFKINLVTPIKAICSLSVSTNSIPTINLQTPSEAIKSLAFSTIRQNPIYANESLKNFYSYLNQQSLYHIELSSDFTLNLGCINDLFQEHTS